MSTELIIGAVSLATLINTVESCIGGYDKFILSAQSSVVGTETSRLSLDIRIEQRKFDMYWRYTGLSRKDCPLLRAQSVHTQKLIVDVVNEVACLLSDSNKLAHDYGFTISKDWNLDATSTPLATNTSLSTIYQSILGYSWFNTAETSIERPAISASRRIRWAWKDHARAVGLLEHLRRYNNELYTYLSPHHEFLLRLGEPSFLLPGFNDPEFLATLVKRTSRGLSAGPMASATELRCSLINFENGEQNRQSLQNVMISAEDIWIAERSNLKIKRDIGSYNGESVIIEYKHIESTLTEAIQNEVRQRLKQLVRLLSVQYHPVFRFPQARGIFEDPQDKNRYGLVFKGFNTSASETLKIDSLSSLLDTESLTYNLGARFKLALALCIAIMQLHAAGWFHKSITPENILFAIPPGASSNPDISEPLLTGFELSRPNRPTEDSLDFQSASQAQNLFLHPDRQDMPTTRFHKKHDYYSLGLCLLCIGLWDSPARLRKLFVANTPNPEDRTSRVQADFLIEHAFSFLGPVCGEVFRDVVLVCLKGDFPMSAGSEEEENRDRVLQTAFFSVVIKRLAECYA